jgi:hypothetical protein
LTIAMNRKLARKTKTYGRSAIVDSSRCIAKACYAALLAVPVDRKNSIAAVSAASICPGE